MQGKIEIRIATGNAGLLTKHHVADVHEFGTLIETLLKNGYDIKITYEEGIAIIEYGYAEHLGYGNATLVWTEEE